MSYYLNVVAFDVPYPPNYGGVIDVYYKLQALKTAGVKVILHAFVYGRKPAPQLETMCEKVFYYERKTGLLSNLSLDPYTVKSRQSEQLEENLLSNEYPILFEVLHTCYLMDDVRFQSRKKIYRHSNIEHAYYLELSRSEKSFLKKMYLKVEAIKLRRFESILNHANQILAVNKKDTAYFKKKYPKAKSVYLPSFHANSTSSGKMGSGDYVLFHGNLAISENYEAVLWLAEHVFSKIEHKVIVAGLNPPDFLVQKLAGLKNLQLKASPNEDEMTQLIRNAQVHVLWTSQPTGLKLKLLNVMFKGRFIVCNSNMLSGTEIQQSSSLSICENADTFIKKIKEYMVKTYTEELAKEREIVTRDFSNLKNVQLLIDTVFGD